MKPGVSSKHITKYSDEERGKNKKLKSDKKRRRRRDSTPSSSSSGSEDDSRALRKSSRREPKRSRRPASSRGDDPSHPRKRRKEPKKPDKRKGRKSRRRRDASVSSTGGSSRSCSTCRGRSSSAGRSRSRSPLRADRKSKSRVRGRSKGRDSGRRSRFRVCSHSSCSGCSRSRSRSRSHFEKKHREKDGSSSLRTKASGETEGRYEDRDKIIQAYDDFRPSRSNDGYEVGRKPEGGTTASEKEARNARDDNGAYKKGEEVILSIANTQPGKNSEDRGNHSFGHEIGSTKNPSEGKNSEVIATTGSSEAEDLELILRQKALENFKKFRGGIPASTLFLGDRKDEAAGTESCKDAGRALEATPLLRTAKSSVKSLICKPDSSTENHSTQGGDCPIKVRVKSVANPVAHRPDDNVSSIPASEGQITQNQLTRVHDSSKEIYAEKASLAKGILDKRADAEPDSSNNRGFEGNRADGSASGSQFEERTFSRMHDGEMVQVSYKVYIPKKTPALARRQLQR